MQLFYNGTQIGETFAVKLVPARDLLRNKAMLGYGFSFTVPIDGYITFNTALECNAKMAATETALQNQNGDLTFKHDDGTNTIHHWLSGQTFTGVRCTMLRWDDKPGAQFETLRSFQAEFEWETHFTSNGAGFLLDFSEEVLIPKPKKNFIVNEFVNNVAPQAIITIDQPKWTATQTGSAIGLNGYPDLLAIAPYLFGGTTPPLKREDVRKRTPERAGANYRGYPITWTYEYESAVILDPNKVPNLWT